MTVCSGSDAGTLERIELFRGYADGWYGNHRGIGPDVADAAARLAQLVGPELVSAVPFDGTIVLLRRWPGSDQPHGREVEVLPGGLMSLVADYGFEDGSVDDFDQRFDADRAAAWLRADSRSLAGRGAGSGAG